MTREQAQKNLELLGLTDVTAEMITNYLNQVNGETKKEKARADQYKADAELKAQLQAQIDELENKNLTDIEKANKATEIANNKAAELEVQLKTMQLKSSLAENGIIGEDADTLLKSITEGNFDAQILGKIISEKIETANADLQKKLLENTPGPDGGNGDGKNGNNDKTSAELVAESIGKKLSGGSGKTTEDIISNYL